MKNKPVKQEFQQASVIRFDSIKQWKSKKGNLFFQVKIGKNYIFISDSLLTYIKKEAA